MIFDIAKIIAVVAGSALCFTFSIVVFKSVLKATSTREAQGSKLSGTPSEVFLGDYPATSAPGREETFQEGMSYDKKRKKLILQGRLSNDYIDDLVG